MISVLFLSPLNVYFDKSTGTVVKSCAVRLSTYICLQIIKKGQERKIFSMSCRIKAAARFAFCLRFYNRCGKGLGICIAAAALTVECHFGIIALSGYAPKRYRTLMTVGIICHHIPISGISA